MTETNDMILFWSGIYSQWHPCTFTYRSCITFDTQTYNCAEQAMMAEKARLFNDDLSLHQIMASTSPKEQKAIGRKIKNFDASEWNKYCREIVKEINIAKFNQNSHLLKSLLSTGNKMIVEASPEDSIWGIGLHETDPNAKDQSKWKGTNWLGIALMEARKELLDQLIDEIVTIRKTKND